MENLISPVSCSKHSRVRTNKEGRTSIHFKADDVNIKMLAKLIKSCKQLCIFFSTSKMLRGVYSAPSHICAEGNLNAT